ncbi:SWF/SNF helicase family protein, partial [Vibrio parahaemolyticus]
VVEEFGKENSKLRLLVCSDVASEGINLHHLSHKMVHFDVPWSLMVFQQRNGRIDRYGQKHQPEIRYLLTQSDNPRISGDTRVLEVLINKDDQAQKNIGDSSEFTRAYSQEEEEAQIADQMMSDDISFDPADWIDNFYSQNSE